MDSKLKVAQWSEILLNPELTKEIDLSIFQALYAFDGHQAAASQIGLFLGYQGKSPHAPVNFEIGRFAKRIAKYYDIDFTERSSRQYKYWDLFFNGWYEDRLFIWQLRPEIVHAIEDCKLTGEQPYPEELPLEKGVALTEGTKKTVFVNAYERNPVAREKCIAHYGVKCSVCEFDFGKAYGDCAKGYIHVHHLKPLASIGEEYAIDPIKDLRPVCANCHSVIHIRPGQPPYTIEEVKRMLRKDYNA